MLHRNTVHQYTRRAIGPLRSVALLLPTGPAVVRAAVRRDGSALEVAGALRADAATVRAAVQQDGDALRSAANNCAPSNTAHQYMDSESEVF